MAGMNLLKIVQKIPLTPPIFNDETIERFGEKVALPHTQFSIPTFASKRLNANGSSLPQAIAHRGHKANHPENSISAFEDAIKVGADAIEADVHLTKDGVVVLSHDPDLKRCFGVDKKIKDYDWDSLQTLRTTRTPHEPLARLQDLLELFQKPKWQSIWLMLDIKIDDDAEMLMRCLAETFQQIDTGNGVPWKDRVLLCYYTAKFIPLCHSYFPGFPISNIGFCIPYSKQFLSVPGTCFSILLPSLLSSSGQKFIQKVQTSQRQIYAWTASHESSMDWCINQGLDGIITDDIPKYLAMYENHGGGNQKEYRWPVKLWLVYKYFNFWIYLFGLILHSRHGISVHDTMEMNKYK